MEIERRAPEEWQPDVESLREDMRYQHRHAEHIQWVGECCRHMMTVFPGMTRRQLMEVFVEADGISGPSGGIFQYRRCPFFKVSVQFGPLRGAPDNEGRVDFHPDDVIKTISRPIVSIIQREYF